MASIKFGSQHDRSQADIRIRTHGNSNSEMTLGDQRDESVRHVAIHDKADNQESAPVRSQGETSVGAETRTGAGQPTKVAELWMTGLFWLFAFALVGVGIAALGRTFDATALPFVLLGILLSYSILGAIILRYAGGLDDESFLRLMALAFKSFSLKR